MGGLRDWFRRVGGRQDGRAHGAERARCEWCGDPLPPGRRRFCSAKCEFGDEFWRES